MRTWKWLLFSVAALALVATALPTRADESNKLTILTFSAPIDLPGVSLPAGKYRFELADPVESRKVIKVSNEDGSKQLAMLLTIPNQMSKPADDPVVMFTETAAGMPHAIKAWFYPGESIGYEFVYPHDQASKIAKSNHTSVLSSENDKIGRVNENGEFAGNEAANTTSQPTLANSGAITTVDSSNRSAENESRAPQTETAAPATTTASSSRAAQSDTSASARPDAAASQSAQADTSANANASRAQTSTAAAPSPRAGRASGAVGTSGQATGTSRRELPKTASPLPWIAVFSGLSLVGAIGIRRLRQVIV